MANIIEVENLKKSYTSKKSGVTEAVKDVSFTVKEGEVFGFLGPNGAGKTTTINVLCTLLNPTAGVARVNGFDVCKNPQEVRKAIGLVFQEITLDKELTARENLEFHCYLYNMDKLLTARRIDEVTEVVGLRDRLDDFVKHFSGGMKRRLEIGRGLLHRPKVIFLDEPTLGLDPQTRNGVWDFIKTLKEKEGNSVFMTTHYMEEAESCDRIAIIDDGRIIANGTPDELKKSVGGDSILLRTMDDDLALKEIKNKLNIEGNISTKGISLIMSEGEKFVPRLLNSLTVDVKEISLKRPTLEEVFLNITGKEIRDEPPVKNR